MIISLKTLSQKKFLLDNHRPLPPDLVKNLEEWFKIELTYSSNGIEGNTLSRQETALVVEKGITVAGKSIVEHLEAINHSDAINYIKSIVHIKRQDITLSHILEIRNLILKGIDNNNAGRFRKVPVRILGSEVILPNPFKVPDLMEEYVQWLQSDLSQLHPIEIASMAHFKLVQIHPFIDGNGRTSRLLMNLILLQYGFTPALIKKEDRSSYINSIEKAELKNDFREYNSIILESINRSLDIYLNAMENTYIAGEAPLSYKKNNNSQVRDQALPYSVQRSLLRIGELSKQSGETVSTIRYWTKEGLINTNSFTESGYSLYDFKTIHIIKQIRQIQALERLTLNEIKQKIN